MIRASCILLLFGLLVCEGMQAQYRFTGVVDPEMSNGQVYLSLVDDYRKAKGIFPEQILARQSIDSLGEFVFTGDNLPSMNRIYRIHVDTCDEFEQDHNHLLGECMNSESLLFIANNSDQVDLPFSFDSEMFCRIDSSNELSGLLLRIDSLEQLMQYEFAAFRSEANRSLNGQRWMDKLLRFSDSLSEPLAELYAFNLMSDRHSPLYPFYRSQVADPYFDRLSKRLEADYDGTNYLEQYRRELAADRYLVEPPADPTPWFWVLGGLLTASVVVNVRLGRQVRSLRPKTVNDQVSLSDQEKRILELILADRSNKEIAGELFISVSTVKTHINNLYKKTGVRSRDEVKSRFS